MSTRVQKLSIFGPTYLFLDTFLNSDKENRAHKVTVLKTFYHYLEMKSAKPGYQKLFQLLESRILKHFDRFVFYDTMDIFHIRILKVLFYVFRCYNMKNKVLTYFVHIWYIICRIKCRL